MRSLARSLRAVHFVKLFLHRAKSVRLLLSLCCIKLFLILPPKAMDVVPQTIFPKQGFQDGMSHMDLRPPFSLSMMGNGETTWRDGVERHLW